MPRQLQMGGTRRTVFWPQIFAAWGFAVISNVRSHVFITLDSLGRRGVCHRAMQGRLRRVFQVTQFNQSVHDFVALKFRQGLDCSANGGSVSDHPTQQNLVDPDRIVLLLSLDCEIEHNLHFLFQVCNDSTFSSRILS